MYKRSFISILILVLSSSLYAQEWEVPLFARQRVADPNVLIILDNSGSMNVLIPATVHLGYLPTPSGAPFEYSYNPSICYYDHKRPDSSLSFQSYGWGLLYTGYYGSGWYRVGYTANRESIAPGDMTPKRRGPGHVWVYFNYHDYCEQWWSHNGGLNSAEWYQGRKIYYYGTRNHDYDSCIRRVPELGNAEVRDNYLWWLVDRARIRWIGSERRIFDVQGRAYDGQHYVVDLPRQNPEFNNDPTPGNPPFDQPSYNPLDYPPNKRMIPVTMDDLSDSKGGRFLDPKKLPSETYNYWKNQPAVRQNLAKFGACLAFDPVAYGLDPYPIRIRFGLMRFDEKSWRASQGGRLSQECKFRERDTDEFKSFDNAIKTMLANTNTPLAETLYDAMRYFKGELPANKNDAGFIPPTPVIKKESLCQKNFIVYLTDGEPCGDIGYDGAPLNKVIKNYDGDDIDERHSFPYEWYPWSPPPGWNEWDGRSGHVGEKCNIKQRNFHRLWQGSDYLDDTALYLYWDKDNDRHRDLLPNEIDYPGNQYLETYTIGLYIDYCMLKEAADYGRGKYYPAWSAEEITRAFVEIMGDIVNKVQSGGAVAVCIIAAEERMEGVPEKEAKDKMIRAKFHPQGWRGYLEAFVIPDKYENEPDWPQLVIFDEDTKEDKEKKAKKNKELVIKYGSWRANGWSRDDRDLHKRGGHYLLRQRSPNDRRIFTYLDMDPRPDEVRMEKVEFKADNWNVGGDKKLYELLETSNEMEARNLINYIRGEEPEELIGAPDWRRRKHDYREDWQEFLPSEPFPDKGRWPMADIVHSTPTQKGGPSENYLTSDYIEFRKEYAKRERMVYVGSNCMFHAFKVGTKLEDGGEEAWAYIPNNLLCKLKYLRRKDYGHLYYVDLTPVIKDVKINGKWRTILVGGERQGNGTYFCLDVTGRLKNPNKPEEGAVVDYDSVKILWEFSHNNLGESWSPPEIRKINVEKNEKEKWVCFVTTGPDRTKENKKKGNAGDALYAIDVANGELIRRIPVNTGKKDTWLTPPAGIDIDLDGDVDYIYAGDTLGNLWKFDLRDEDPNNWSVSKLFKAEHNGTPQPITARPTLAYGPSYEIMVYFGTGRYEVDSDIFNKEQQTFYCLRDVKGEEIKKTELQNKTDDESNKIDPNKYGWYINLGKHKKIHEEDPADVDPDDLKGDTYYRKGERVTKEALIYRGMVIFTSFVPIDKACKAGAWSYIYAVVYNTGGNPSKPMMDTTDDMVVDSKDKIVRSRALDPGAKDRVAVGVASKPVVDVRRDAILTQTSLGGRITVVKIDPLLERVRVRSWREL